MVSHNGLEQFIYNQENRLILSLNPLYPIVPIGISALFTKKTYFWQLVKREDYSESVHTYWFATIKKVQTISQAHIKQLIRLQTTSTKPTIHSKCGMGRLDGSCFDKHSSKLFMEAEKGTALRFVSRVPRSASRFAFCISRLEFRASRFELRNSHVRLFLVLLGPGL